MFSLFTICNLFEKKKKKTAVYEKNSGDIEYTEYRDVQMRPYAFIV